jgi:2'-5' RNA ligase
VHWPIITAALSGVGEFDARGRPNALWAGIAPHAQL